MNYLKSLNIAIAMIYFLTGELSFAMPEFMERAYSEQKKACEAGFVKEYIKAGTFNLATYQRGVSPAETIRIYIEGDGRAWETKSRLSDDPTPSDPVAMTLATADPSGAVAYVARPGQFPASGTPDCDPTYWSARRFAPEVIEAFDKSIETLKLKYKADKVELIGYSGGAAIAILVAARRKDIASIRTIAGNLDIKTFCSYHNVSQLDGSLNPADVAGKVSAIPMRHFVGSKDLTIPPLIAESFAKREGDINLKSVTIIDGATHKTGWLNR